MKENQRTVGFLQSWKEWLNGAGKGQILGFVLSVVVMAIISVMYFYPDAIVGNELRQYDTLQGSANGQEAKEYYEATGERTLWTNSLFSGMPTFQISPYYESNDLMSWVGDVLGLWLPVPANLLFMMMIGFFIMLLAFRTKWYLALIGAIAWGFSSYFIILIGAGHIWKYVTLAYIPPTIAGIVLCYRGRYLMGGVLAALFAMMQISSNHLQMSYYFLIVIAALVIGFLVAAVRNKKMRQWTIATASLVVAAVLAVGANLPNLYNTYEYSKETMRGQHSELSSSSDGTNATKGLDKDYILQYSYTPSETFSLLIPNVKGGATVKPEKGHHTPLTLADLPEAKAAVAESRIGYNDAANLQAFSQYFGAPEGTNGPVYVGAVIVALFLLGCIIVKGPIAWALISMTALSILLSWGRYCGWLSELFIDYFPLYSKFRTVESILVIAEFTIPLLAILAMCKLVNTSTPWVRYRKAFYVAWGVAVLFCLAGVVCPGVFGSYLGEGEMEYLAQGYDKQMPELFGMVESLRYGMIRSDALRSLFFIVAAGIAVAMFMKGKMPKWGMCTIVGLIVLADLYTVNKRYLDHESFCTPEITRTEAFPLRESDKAILADTAMNYRVIDLQRFSSPAPSYHHKMVGGYHAAKLTRYQDMINRHLGQLKSPADFNVLNMLNTKYIIRDANTVIPNPNALGNAWWVDNIIYAQDADAEMAALDSINPSITAVADEQFRDILGDVVPQVAEGDTIFETSYKPNCLTYHASTKNGGLAVFSEVYFPWGWKATIDGTPVDLGRVNYLLRALKVPAGTHSIEMKFDPDSVKVTVTIAKCAIILIFISLLVALLFCCKTRVEGDNNDESI